MAKNQESKVALSLEVRSCTNTEREEHSPHLVESCATLYIYGKDGVKTPLANLLCPDSQDEIVEDPIETMVDMLGILKEFMIELELKEEEVHMKPHLHLVE